MARVIVKVKRMRNGHLVYVPKIGQRLARTGFTLYRTDRSEANTRAQVEQRYRGRGHTVEFQ